MSDPSLEYFDQAKKCAHCGTRFDPKKPRKRKRTLVGQDRILQTLNITREVRGQAPLNYGDFICHGCFRVEEYATSSASSQISDDVSPMDISSGETEPPGSPQGALPTSQPEYGASSTIQEIQLPGTSRGLQPSRPDLEDHKCVSCPLVFDLNPEVPKRVLGSVEIVRLLINGQRADFGQPQADRERNICEPCYANKLAAFRQLWAMLQENTSPARQSHEERIPEAPASETQEEDVQTSDATHDVDETSEESQYESDRDDYGETSAESSPDESSQSEPEEGEEEPDMEVEVAPFSVVLPITSLRITEHRCCICDIRVNTRMLRPTRANIWLRLGIFIPDNSRCCLHHRDLSNQSFLNNEALGLLRALPVQIATTFSSQTLLDFIGCISESARKTHDLVGRLSFSSDNIYSEETYQTLLSCTRAQFETLHDICKPHLRSRGLHSKDKVAIFLMKIRVNLTQKALGCIFRVDQSSISKSFDKVMEILLKEFVPNHLGYAHLGREDFINAHTTQIAKLLTGANDSQAIVVIDGTYLYIQKSRNFRLQRRTYSMHKFRNLLKVMMVVSTTGYILAIEGPYYADSANNDARILNNMLTDPHGFKSFFKSADFIVEDRGFRDSNALLSDLGYSIKMPHFLGRRAQHTDIEANESRLVTKIRWVVESVNGRLKNVFKFFRDVIPNKYIKMNKAYKIFQISCALLNAFHPPLAVDRETDAKVAEEMRVRSEMHNLFMNHLREYNLMRDTRQWTMLTDNDLVDFPRLTRDELREFTFGIYQLHLAESYMTDSNNEFGNYDIHFHPYLGKQIVRFKIQSRFHSTRQHFMWVGYTTHYTGVKSITGWCCNCPNGSRIVGCCAHIAAVLWYLCYARYLERIVPPAANLDSAVRDAATYRYEHDLIDTPPVDEQRLEAQHALHRSTGTNDNAAVQSSSPSEVSDDSSDTWLRE